MQRTVLSDERAAVDTDHFMLRKGFLQGFPGLFVQGRLMVSRHQYGPVDHQEIGVCGRKPSKMASGMGRATSR